jgi:hypothetical protein
MKWFERIRRGDMLSPIPLWNATAGRTSRLSNLTEVLDVIPAQSQSGVLFRVRTLGGIECDLDAAWFEDPTSGNEVGMDATDKNLLERAALACGDPVERWTEDANFVPVAILRSGTRFQPLLSNLLTDSMGDAFRLAATLNIGVKRHRGPPEIGGPFECATAALGDGQWFGEECKGDPGAAMRRVIVRAAAEVGKTIEQQPEGQA